MKTIYLVRHGETQNNVEKRSGHPDDPLTEKGEKQAHLLGQRFLHIPIDTVVSSPYTRAHRTAEAIGKVKKIPIQISELFHEVVGPSIFIGKSYDDPSLLDLRKQRHDNWGNPDWRHSDEENFFDVLERAKKAQAFLEEHPSNNLAVTSHGGFMRVLAGLILLRDKYTAELSTVLYPALGVSNTGITVLQYEKKKWTLFRWNDTVHLDPNTQAII